MKAGTGGALMADHERKAVAARVPYLHVLDGTCDAVELQGHNINKPSYTAPYSGRANRARGLISAKGGGLLMLLTHEGARRNFGGNRSLARFCDTELWRSPRTDLPLDPALSKHAGDRPFARGM
jgi:hypothetical protein